MANPVTASPQSLPLDVAERADQRARKANRNSLFSALFAFLILLWSILWAFFGPGIMHGLHDPSTTMKIGNSVAKSDKNPGTVDFTFSGDTLSKPIEGSGSHIARDHELWLVVRPLPDSPWYPVEKINQQPDDTWSIPGDHVRLKPAGAFEIFVFDATSRAASSFRVYLTVHGDDANPPGMEVLPPEATYLTSMRVVRES
jgi:hypothetical protein